MKTSNKLLLAFVLGTFLASIAIHGVLYGRYRKGQLVGERRLHAETFTHYDLPRPRVLVLDGDIWVNLVPGEGFSLELSRKNEDPDAGMFAITPTVKLKGVQAARPAVVYEQRGDTLFVRGNVRVTVHRPYSDYAYRRQLPQVNIIGSVPGEIVVNNGQLYLQGGPSAATSRSARVQVRDATLWIGMQYESNVRGQPEFFDSLDIRSDNSILVLNHSATIDHLQADLTDSSVITDQYSTLTHSVIRSDPGSRMNLPGENLKRNQIIIP
jgi:hypothetical protein